jgi:hypothetical protein
LYQHLTIIIIMKKIVLLTPLLLFGLLASAQILPSFQFGIKGGVNLSKFSTNNTFNSDNQAGYLGGIWARIGALGINFQPEAYYTSKIATVTNGNYSSTVKLNSIDVPALVGFKFGTFGIGGRLYTGPVASFILSQDQTFKSAVADIAHLSFKDQNYAWQFGAGVDISSLSVDLRYEKGLSNLNNSGYDQKLNLFNLSLGYRLF